MSGRGLCQLIPEINDDLFGLRLLGVWRRGEGDNGFIELRLLLREATFGGGHAVGQGGRIGIERSDPRPIGRVKDAEFTRPITDHEPVGLVAVCRREADVGPRLEGTLLRAIRLPEFRNLVAAHRHEPAVPCEVDRGDTAAVCRPGFHE